MCSKRNSPASLTPLSSQTTFRRASSTSTSASINTANAGENNPAARRAQLEARLERQRHLYELGDWTRERYLAARNEMLSELAELDMSHPTNPAEDPEAITRLGAYVRELRTAWRDADKAQRRLLVRTLFEQIWVVGDRLFAAKPVPQFAPFFRLVRNLQGDDVEQRVYLAPTFSLQDEDADGILTKSRKWAR